MHKLQNFYFGSQVMPALKDVKGPAVHSGGLHTSVFLFRMPRLPLLPEFMLRYVGLRLGDAELARVRGKSGSCIMFCWPVCWHWPCWKGVSCKLHCCTSEKASSAGCRKSWRKDASKASLPKLELLRKSIPIALELDYAQEIDGLPRQRPLSGTRVPCRLTQSQSPGNSSGVLQG